MNLIALKDFQIVGGKRVKRDQRFELDDTIGGLYLRTGNAAIAPPKPRQKAMVAEAPAPYLTRALTSVVEAVTVPVKRGRGRPRKVKPAE